MTDFVHLHVHSDYSLLDGCAKVGRLLKHTQGLGMKALALTDHGNMFGAINFYEKAKEIGIKSIIGSELYIVVDHKNTERPQRGKVDADGNEINGGALQNKIFHMGVLAQDNEGYANLTKLVSDAHLKGFYYRPRTDLEKLAQYSKGLVGFSGCMQGVIPQHLLHGDEAGARRYLEKFLEIFGKERFIIELQDHGYEEQRRLNPMLLKLAKQYGLMAVCTNDSHYVEEGDHIAHDMLLCIQTGAKLADTDRMRFDKTAFYIKTPQQMADIFGEEPQLLTNTVALAERCNVSFDFKKNNYPTYRMTEEERAKFTSNKELLKAICTKKLYKKYEVNYDPQSGDEETRKISLRLDAELGIIERMGYVDYFLIVQDIVAWAVSQNIPVSARGSAVGSIVCYLCDIGNTEPLKFKLFFERFLNPERVSPADIDLDICMRRRGEVIEYLKKRYGVENVANIITYGTFGAKMVIRDICRIKDLPFAEADRIAKMVPEGINPKTQHAWDLEHAAQNPEFANELKVNPLAQEIFTHGKIIEGMVRSTGKHAAGILITERPLSEYLPLTLQEGDVTTQYDMRNVEKLGLLKMDLLGLKTLTVISDAVALVKQYREPNFDLEKATKSLDDPKVFEIIRDGRTTGIFQLESGGMQNTVRQVGVTDIFDISVIIALYRPGPMALIPTYAEAKKDPSKVHYPHPLMEEVLKETYGVMAYQEQVMEAAKILAGYTLGGADILRRAMGKKKPEEMEKQRKVFVEGAAKTNNIPEKEALEIFALIEKFSGYGFNKSHTVAYAIVAYQTGYLKAYYPAEFMAAVLGCELGNADNVSKFIGECTAMGLQVLGPDINESGLNFTPVGDKIRFGIGGIKGVGEAGAARIIEERKLGGPFKNFDNFIKRIDSKQVNRRVIENLAKTGAFDACGDERAALIENLEEKIKGGSKKDTNQGMLFDFDAIAQEHGENKTIEPLPFQTRLQYERELLGFYVTGHPLDEFLGLTEAVDTAPDLRELGDKKYFRVCGVVSEVAKKFSKKDNQPWALFKLSTRTSTYEMSIFSTNYAKDGSLLIDGALVMMVGQVREQNGEKRFTIESVKLLSPMIGSLIKKITFTIKSDKKCLAWLKELKAELLRSSGDIAIQLALATDNEAAIAQLPESLKWKFDLKSFHNIARSPCVEKVKATAVEFVPPERKPWENKNGANGATKAPFIRK